jgi:hypothetical protein
MSEVALAPDNTKEMVGNSLEISVKGKWVRVPAFPFNGDTLVVKGNWLKIANIHDEEWLDHEVDNPERCIEQLNAARARGINSDIFTFSQKPLQTVSKFPFHVEHDSIAAIRLKSFNEWWEALPQEGRKNVRRAQKRGVNIVVKGLDDDLISGIVTLNNDSPTRQGRPYAHYGKSFEQVKKDHSAFLDRSDFICAYVGEELIGFLKLVYRGDVASILQLTPRASHNDKRPANALLSKAVELCAEKGIQCLIYGKYFYETRRHSPLLEFKVRNGFEEILVPRYYVPITTWGRLCINLKLYRGFMGILPKNVALTAVTLREKWYYKKS